MVLDKINIDFENHNTLPEEKETYQIGEEINKKIKDLSITFLIKYFNLIKEITHFNATEA